MCNEASNTGDTDTAAAGGTRDDEAGCADATGDNTTGDQGGGGGEKGRRGEEGWRKRVGERGERTVVLAQNTPIYQQHHTNMVCGLFVSVPSRCHRSTHNTALHTLTGVL